MGKSEDRTADWDAIETMGECAVPVRGVVGRVQVCGRCRARGCGVVGQSGHTDPRR